MSNSDTNIVINTTTDNYSLSVLNAEGPTRWGLIVGNLSAQRDLYSNLEVLSSLVDTNQKNAYTTLNSNSASWDNTYAWVNSNSANATFQTVSAISLFGVFYGDGSNLIGASLPGQADINTLIRSNSAEWNDAYNISTAYHDVSSSFATIEFAESKYVQLTSYTPDRLKNGIYELTLDESGLVNLPGSVAPGGNARIQSTNSIDIYSNTSLWMFGTDGVLSTPGDITSPGAISVSGGNSNLWNDSYTNLLNLSSTYASVTSIQGTIYQIDANNDKGNVVLSLPQSFRTPGDLNVGGNLFIAGSGITLTTSTLTVSSPILYINNSLSGENGNVYDIGLVGHFKSNLYQHTGLVRSAQNNYWSLFSGLTTEPLNGPTINYNDPTFTIDTLRANILGSLSGNVVGNITGNADTVTNGVYTNGSYSDPSWITSLADTKITGTNFATNTLLESTSALLTPLTTTNALTGSLLTTLQSTSALLTPLTTTNALTGQLVLNTAINSLTGNWNDAYNNLLPFGSIGGANGITILTTPEQPGGTPLDRSVIITFSNAPNALVTIPRNLSVSGISVVPILSSFNINSPDWNSSYTWVKTNSAIATFTTSVSAPSLSGTFYGDGSNLIGASLPGQASINTLVRGTSANWNSAYTISTAYQNTSGSFATNTLLQSTSALLTPVTLTNNLTGQLVTNTNFNNYKTTVASSTATLLPTTIYQNASGSFVQSNTAASVSMSAIKNIVALSATAYAGLGTYDPYTVYILV